MSKTFSYQSDEYDKQKQRFVIPLYIKDNLGNYNHSSTGTLVKYNEHNYVIFAAHALEKDIDINDIYTFSSNGTMYEIIEDSIGHCVFKEDDIVIIDHFNTAFNGKNYFDLNTNHLSGFNENYFAWIGFPVSKSKTKTIHKTKSEETLRREYVHSNKDGRFFKNVKYFIIESKLLSKNNNSIQGEYNRKNANLKHQGKVSMGPHPKGMSGGAMFFFTKEQKLEKTLEDTFRFAGIGLQYKDDNKIIGIARDRIIELINTFDKENPVQLFLKHQTMSGKV